MAWLKKRRQEEIETKVDEILAKTGLSVPEENVFEIAKAMGVKVHLVDFEELFEGANDVQGVIQYPDNDGGEQVTASIYLNKNTNAKKQIFTLAHELGHFVLHNGYAKLRVDKFNYRENTQEALEETEANFFAATLLIPKSKLKEARHVTTKVSVLAGYFGVSDAVVRNRLRWLEKN
jgi:Zn-dependent peptidase ImmA (M78 family)